MIRVPKVFHVIFEVFREVLKHPSDINKRSGRCQNVVEGVGSLWKGLEGYGSF